MAVRHIPWISPAEYLDGEAIAENRHMYLAGEVTAMAGGTVAHNTIAGNLMGQLYAGLRGKNCRVVGSDQLFAPGSGDIYTYPDAMVICGAVVTVEGYPNVVKNPVFVAEILSPSTEALDRGAKSAAYRATGSVKQYALISQDQATVEIHTRDEAGFWRIHDVQGLDAECDLSGIGCRVPMAALYEGVF
jgi:Uma2 family endonuclease